MQINPQSANVTGSVAQLLEKFLPQSKEVNEEQLFTGLVAAKLSVLKGPEIGSLYNKSVNEMMEKAGSTKRRVQLEDVAIQTLDSLVSEKKLTKPERDKIFAESFRAAQLDSDTTKLFDSKGSKNDPTIAVQERTKAMNSALELIKQIDKGTVKISDPSTTSPGATKTNGMPDGFLFKPVSSNSGTLAVLIPAEMGKNASSVRLIDSRGKVISQGRFTSFGETGEKAKYSFSKPGSSYPKNISVEIILKDGTRTQIPISDPAKRYE